MKKILKENKAITLIALVITIVVLIILAAVLINLTLGENGIFTRAKLAKQKYEYSAAKETVDLKLVEIQTECIAEGKPYTIKYISDEMSDTNEKNIEVIYYYEATAKTQLSSIPNSLDGIVVIDVNYPMYKFLIGKKSDESIGIEGVLKTESTAPEIGQFTETESFETACFGQVIETEPDVTKYTVRYMSDGAEYTREYVVEGNSATLPVIAKPYRTFNGWSLTDGGEVIDGTYTPTESVSLYANWTVVPSSNLKKHKLNTNICSDNRIYWEAYGAWDGGWGSDGVGDHWIQLDLDAPALVTQAQFKVGYSDWYRNGVDTISLVGIGTNGEVELFSDTNVPYSDNSLVSYDINTDMEFSSYKMYISNADKGVAIRDLRFYGYSSCTTVH